MKRYTFALALLAAVVVTLTVPSTALAADTYHYQFRGKSAWVEFYSFDPASCNTTSAWISVGENRSRTSPGPATSNAWVDLSIYQWNYCTYESSCSYGSAAVPDDAFRFVGNLASATLNTTIDLADCYTGATQSVPVAIAWTGEGEVGMSNNHSSYHFPGYRYTSRSHGQSRYAQVSGSVMVGGVNVIEGASSYGYMSATNLGTIFINRQ